ncbi:hypothetical protein MHB71_17380 [Paenibacillus sp. FSL H7-0940]|uniref:hypothetical protein n=1 Tax=Paenibacillus sp. FSL H7-0940 TaxID=2921443 RepID=UPI0030EEA38D
MTQNQATNTALITLLKGDKTKFNAMPLEDTLRWLAEYGEFLAENVEFLKDFESSEHLEKMNELLSPETITRYKGVSLTLEYPYKNFKEMSKRLDAGTLEKVEQGLLIQSWSSLGSFLESTLQMFLSFYYRFYIQSTWNTWNAAAIVQLQKIMNQDLKQSLDLIISQTASQGGTGVTGDIRRSFLKRVKEILKDKEALSPVEEMTLTPLIDFYFYERIFAEREYTFADLRKLARYRNAIHAFKKRESGSWAELNEHAKNLILLIRDIITRLPAIWDIPDTPIPQWYYDKETMLTMKEHEWFRFQMKLHFDADQFNEGQ